MAYQVVDWLYDNLDDDAFTDEVVLKREIQKLDDGTGRLEGWLDTDKQWLTRINTVSPKVNRTFQQTIDDFREQAEAVETERIDEGVESLKQRIEGFTRSEQLEDVVLGDVEDEFGKEARNEISLLVAEKGEELFDLENP